MESRQPRGRLPWVLGGVGLAGVLAVLAIVLDLGPFTEPEVMRAELIARGDETCRKAHEAFVELQDQPPQTPRQASELTGQLIDIAEDESDQLESLNAPAELRPDLARYLAARERGIEALRRGREAADARDTDAYREAQAELADSQHERARIARGIGFGECSRPLAG
jgi:hypothetical protein